MTDEKKSPGPYIAKKSWQDFRDSGVFWWMNSVLHVFGWVIVVEIEEGTGEVTGAYPARTRYRGFALDDQAEGFRKVSDFMVENAVHLKNEAYED